jgi:hypothetical protein
MLMTIGHRGLSAGGSAVSEVPLRQLVSPRRDDTFRLRTHVG